MATSTQLLDLDGLGQRSADIRFDVLDQTLTRIGTIAADADAGTRVLNNSNATIKRTLQNLRLNASVQADLDPFGDRLRPMFVLENGAEYALGVFILGGIDRARWEWGLDADVAGIDQGLILDQPLERTIGYPAGTNVRDAILEQFATALVPVYDVDPTIETELPNPISWPAGTQASRGKIINELAALAGAYSYWFDNQGTGRVLRVPDLATSVPTLVYDSDGRILHGSMVETDDILEAPNRYIVVETGNPDAAISGWYDIPDDAPHSAVNRGFVIATVIDEQGLGSVAQAEQRAQAAYAQASGTFEWVQFSSPPDPRHDTFDAVLYLGGVYREQAWSMPLIEGGEMTHDLRRVYGVV